MPCERLESRRLLAVTASLVDHVLTVTGDANANHVSISRDTTANTLIVRSSDVIIKTSAYSDVNQIKVSLLGGDDSLVIGTNVEKPSTVSGEMPRICAVSATVLPRAAQARTSFSRAVN